MKSWNSTTIALAWAPPENKKYSLFLITVFHLNGTDYVTEEEHLWQTGDGLEFVMSDLHPCTRVRFGLQTVCEKGMESRFSEMVYNDGNSRKYNFLSDQLRFAKPLFLPLLLGPDSESGFTKLGFRTKTLNCATQSLRASEPGSTIGLINSESQLPRVTLMQEDLKSFIHGMQIT